MISLPACTARSVEHISQTLLSFVDLSCLHWLQPHSWSQGCRFSPPSTRRPRFRVSFWSSCGRSSFVGRGWAGLATSFPLGNDWASFRRLVKLEQLPGEILNLAHTTSKHVSQQARRSLSRQELCTQKCQCLIDVYSEQIRIAQAMNKQHSGELPHTCQDRQAVGSRLELLSGHLTFQVYLIRVPPKHFRVWARAHSLVPLGRRGSVAAASLFQRHIPCFYLVCFY